jgi:hypothetical protein
VALTQTDIDKLEKAIALGVRTVQYTDHSVTYQSTTDMLKALDYAKQQLAAAGEKRPPSTLAIFDRC